MSVLRGAWDGAAARLAGLGRLLVLPREWKGVEMDHQTSEFSVNSTFTVNAPKVAVPTEPHDHCWHQVIPETRELLIRVHTCCKCGVQGRSFGLNVQPEGHGPFINEIAWTDVRQYADGEFYRVPPFTASQMWTLAKEAAEKP